MALVASVTIFLCQPSRAVRRDRQWSCSENKAKAIAMPPVLPVPKLHPALATPLL